MSMLSAQCDELRSMAESVGLAMPRAATLMMEAADTITELRGALQVASVDYRHLQAENAKLREEAEKAWRAAERLCQVFDGPCRDDGVTIYKPCPMGERDEECVYGQLQRELRELGVEVDA